jgi:predicted  nucleic acid-binding Zn-ribbon protein
MAQAQEPNDKNYEVERQLRSLNRRVERLEDTQVTGRELNRGFDRVYEEIDHLEDKVDRLQSDFEGFRDEINQKLDTILRHIPRTAIICVF